MTHKKINETVIKKVRTFKITKHCYIEIKLLFQSDLRNTLEEWREDYGDIVGFYMGSEPSVILSDFQTIAEYEKMRAASLAYHVLFSSYKGTREAGARKGALIDENLSI